MSKRDNKLLVQDMIEACEKILRYTEDKDIVSFVQSEITVDAVVRNFGIIGEAANRLDEKFKSENHLVNWDQLRGFRNRIVHEYFGIDHQIVWEIIENDLPLLQQ